MQGSLVILVPRLSSGSPNAYGGNRYSLPLIARPSQERSTAAPLDEAWMLAESYRTIRTPMKELLPRTETLPELAALNVFIRECSLATA